MSIACPTCKLMNDEDESTCRRCFTPLVVTVRGSATGGAKAYSRRFVEMTRQGRSFSWLRIAAGSAGLLILGLLLHNAAQRLGKEPTRVKVSPPQVAQILQVAIKHQNDRLLLTNNDGFDWTVVELVLNTAKPDQTNTQPCCWRLVVPRVDTRQTAVIELSSFKDKQGNAFDPRTTKLLSLQVSCYVGGKIHKAAAWFN